jgi:hypothetical protein
MLKDRLIEEVRSLRFKLNSGHFKVVRMAFVISIAISIPVTVYLAQKGFFKTTQAAATASFSFSPNQFILPGDKSVSLLVNTGTSTIGFAQAEIKYDTTQLKINSFTPGSKLTRIISQTTLTEANLHGSFRVALGLDPSMYASAPSGTFELGRFTFSANTTSPNSSRTITQDAAASQVVTLRLEEATISPAIAAATINPQVSCSSLSVVDAAVTGGTYDRVRMRVRNNSGQTVYLTNSKLTWSSAQPGLTLDWFSSGNNQYYAGDSTVSPTSSSPLGAIPLPAGATGSWFARFIGQPATGLRGTFTPELTFNNTCTYSRSASR